LTYPIVSRVPAMLNWRSAWLPLDPPIGGSSLA
jgi:hypothetical protein